MPVISVPQAFNEEELYVDLRPIFGQPLFLKCEGFNFAGSIKLKAASEMVEAADREGALRAGIGPGRVVLGKPGRGVEHDRGEQGPPVRMRNRLPVQPVDQAADGGTGQRGARHHRTRPHRRLSRRAARLRPRPVRRRRPLRLAQPVHQPGQLAGALPFDGASHRPPVPPARRAVRRVGHHGDLDGLRTLLPGVAPSGTGRGGGQRRLGDLRRLAGPPDDPRPRRECPPAAAR